MTGKGVLFLCLLLVAASAEEEAAAASNGGGFTIPEHYQVAFQTDVMVGGVKQMFEVNVTTAFAPLGAEQFYKLVKDGYYDGACFFRVVPDFVIQFGIAADPAMTTKWNTVPILDDPVEVSNEAGTIAFASSGPDTRTSQVFVNYNDNRMLDTQGFAPFGQVISGMEALRKAYDPTPGKPGGVDQSQYEEKGNAWLVPKVPKINQITKAWIK